MNFFKRLLWFFNPKQTQLIDVENYDIEALVSHIISNSADGLNTAALMIYHSGSRQTISNTIADVRFAIGQINNGGYLPRSIARAIENQCVNDGLTLLEFCRGDMALIKQYMEAVVELQTMYRNLAYVETKEAAHTVRLLTGYLEFHRTTLINISKCL